MTETQGHMRIYHNPRCSKSRQTLQRIRDRGIEPKIVEYLETPPTAEQLDEILKMLDLAPKELMRCGKSIYKELGLAQKQLSRAAAIKLMVENPNLIERPIVVQGERAILGRPPENVDELFSV